MTRTYCDRCSAETTDRQSGHILGTDDADNEGNAVKGHDVDVELCLDCYAEFRTWARKERRRRPATKREKADGHD